MYVEAVPTLKKMLAVLNGFPEILAAVRSGPEKLGFMCVHTSGFSPAKSRIVAVSSGYIRDGVLVSGDEFPVTLVMGNGEPYPGLTISESDPTNTGPDWYTGYAINMERANLLPAVSADEVSHGLDCTQFAHVLYARLLQHASREDGYYIGCALAGFGTLFVDTLLDATGVSKEADYWPRIVDIGLLEKACCSEFLPWVSDTFEEWLARVDRAKAPRGVRWSLSGHMVNKYHLRRAGEQPTAQYDVVALVRFMVLLQRVCTELSVVPAG